MVEWRNGEKKRKAQSENESENERQRERMLRDTRIGSRTPYHIHHPYTDTDAGSKGKDKSKDTYAPPPPPATRLGTTTCPSRPSRAFLSPSPSSLPPYPCYPLVFVCSNHFQGPWCLQATLTFICYRPTYCLLLKS